MINIIPLNVFLFEEALPLKLAKEYVRYGEGRSPLTNAKMDVVFNNKQRLYLPIVKKVKSTVEPKIKEFLASIGYEIKDYIGNSAFKSDNPRREGRIGKLLSQNGRADLQNLFLQDPIRALATQQAEYSVVISRHPYDVAGMSCGTGREPWHSSCLNLKRPDGSVGMNAHYVPKEIKNGTLTAYYIKSSDKNINKPLGRVNIKPYKKEEELNQKDKQKCYFPDTRVYGNFPPDALLALKEWIISWQGDLTGDFYKWKGCYDYDGTAYHIRVSSNMDIKQIESTKGNRNVDNFNIVNDVDGEVVEGCPDGEIGDLLWLGRTRLFDDYVNRYSDGVVDYNYRVTMERIDDNCTPIVRDSYINYNLENFTLDYTLPTIPLIDGSWGIRRGGNEGEPTIYINSIDGLFFKSAGIKDFMKFYNPDHSLSITGSLVFQNCNFKASDLPDPSKIFKNVDLLDEGWSERVMNRRVMGGALLVYLILTGEIDVLIDGGDIINVYNILVILYELCRLYQPDHPLVLNIRIVNIELTNKKNLQILEQYIETKQMFFAHRVRITKDWDK